MTDDPKDLATIVASMPKPLLVASDVDGTLSDIVEEPGDARLVPGAVEALSALLEHGCDVAIVSGRPMCDLVVQFGVPDSLHLIGSHGAELGADPERSMRTALESAALDEINALFERIAAEHEGAWVESKPFAMALHVRRCSPEVGERALLAARTALADLTEARTMEGHMVFEAMVRNTSKRAALSLLREQLQPGTTIFLGDDASDEGVFESLGASDLGIKIGPGVTLATHRLAIPQDSVEFLIALASMMRPAAARA